MSKMYGSELQQRLAEAGMQILGLRRPAGAAAAGRRWPAALEQYYLLAVRPHRRRRHQRDPAQHHRRPRPGPAAGLGGRRRWTVPSDEQPPDAPAPAEAGSCRRRSRLHLRVFLLASSAASSASSAPFVQEIPRRRASPPPLPRRADHRGARQADRRLPPPGALAPPAPRPAPHRAPGGRSPASPSASSRPWSTSRLRRRPARLVRDLPLHAAARPARHRQLHRRPRHQPRPAGLGPQGLAAAEGDPQLLPRRHRPARRLQHRRHGARRSPASSTTSRPLRPAAAGTPRR